MAKGEVDGDRRRVHCRNAWRARAGAVLDMMVDVDGIGRETEADTIYKVSSFSLELLDDPSSAGVPRYAHHVTETMTSGNRPCGIASTC